MTQASALAHVTKRVGKKAGERYPYAEKRGGLLVVGYRELPQTGCGPPEDIVLGFGPSWDDAIAGMEAP